MKTSISSSFKGIDIFIVLQKETYRKIMVTENLFPSCGYHHIFLNVELLGCKKCGLVLEDNGEKVLQPECIEHLTTVIEVCKTCILVTF